MNKKLLLSAFTSLGLFLLPLASSAALAPGNNLEKLEFGAQLISPAGQFRDGQAAIPVEDAGAKIFADLCGSCHRNTDAKNANLAYQNIGLTKI